MFIAALFVIGRNWKHPICPSTQKWIRKMWYIYTKKYCSGVKKKILKLAGKWKELENIIHNAVTQTQKDNHLCTHLLLDINCNVHGNSQNQRG